MKRMILAFMLLGFSGMAGAQVERSLEKANKETIISEPKEVEKDPIFVTVEKNPEFPGGTEALYQFIAANIKWPCKDCDCFGRVFVTFVIEKDGKVSNAKVLRDICSPEAGFGEEALRVVNLMPKWKPGYQNGKPVRVQYNLPINFTLK